MGLGSSIYALTVRPALFRYSDPEDSHEASKGMLRGSMPTVLLRSYSDIGRKELSVNLGGKVRLEGPVGIAAGFDKDAELLHGLSNLFDYVTFGTMLPYPWPGNKRTDESRPGSARIVRIEEDEAMLNCLGFPFAGPDGALERVSRYYGKSPLNASIAVRPPLDESGMRGAVDQFESMVDALSRHVPSKVGMVEANFASPNTKGLAVFFEKGVFEELAGIMASKMKSALLLMKMPPHLDQQSRDRNMGVVRRWMDLGGDGITAINTIRTEDPRLSMGAGGKSGRPIFEVMMRNLADYRKEFGSGIVVNAVGGISADRVAQAIIEGQADTVQALTPFIYHGPTYVRDAKTALLLALKKSGHESLQALRESRGSTGK